MRFFNTGTAVQSSTTPPDNLTVIGGRQHGLEAASRLEVASDDVPLVITGFGLAFVLEPASLLVNIRGSLMIGRRDGQYFVIRAIVTPAAAPASELPASSGPDPRAKAFATGPNGPTISLEPQVESLNAAFSSIALERSASCQAWCVVAPVGTLPIPSGASLASVSADDPSATFLIRPGTSTLDFMELNGPHSAQPRMEDVQFEGARSDGQGSTGLSRGDIRWLGVTYEAEGHTWRQRFYGLPLDGTDCMTLKMQSRAATADSSFALADQIASGFVRSSSHR